MRVKTAEGIRQVLFVEDLIEALKASTVELKAGEFQVNFRVQGRVETKVILPSLLAEELEKLIIK